MLCLCLYLGHTVCNSGSCSSPPAETLGCPGSQLKRPPSCVLLYPSCCHVCSSGHSSTLQLDLQPPVVGDLTTSNAEAGIYFEDSLRGGISPLPPPPGPRSTSVQLQGLVSTTPLPSLGQQRPQSVARKLDELLGIDPTAQAEAAATYGVGPAVDLDAATEIERALSSLFIEALSIDNSR